jgi:hypothetical protein
MHQVLLVIVLLLLLLVVVVSHVGKDSSSIQTVAHQIASQSHCCCTLGQFTRNTSQSKPFVCCQQ